MATATGNYVSDNSSLANFKSWAQAISNAISGFGWVQTADAGQVNWGSIASVPSSAYVYEIWKANDTAAATLPIYLKIEYGFSATSPRIRMTVGTGSNGSGTITGGVVTGAPWEITNLETNQGATTFPCFFSGDAGQFRMYMWQSVAVNVGTLFGIERSKDSSGAVTTDYFTVLSMSANNTSAVSGGPNNQQTILSASLIGNRDCGIVAVSLTSTSNTGAFNGTVAAFPVLPVLGKCGNPMLGFQACCASDISDGATVTVASLYGGTHTFIGVSHANFWANMGTRGTNSSNIAMLMLYE